MRQCLQYHPCFNSEAAFSSPSLKGNSVSFSNLSLSRKATVELRHRLHFKFFTSDQEVKYLGQVMVTLKKKFVSIKLGFLPFCQK